MPKHLFFRKTLDMIYLFDHVERLATWRSVLNFEVFSCDM